MPRVHLFARLKMPRHSLGRLFRSPVADFMQAVYGDDEDWSLNSLDKQKVVRDATIRIRELERQNKTLRDYVRSQRDGDCNTCKHAAGRFIDGFKAYFKLKPRDYT